MATESDRAASRLDAALRADVFQGERYKPFGELSPAEARGRAAELDAAGDWGPLQRARPVAKAWSELATLMDERGVDSVGALDAETVVGYAERLWVIPPAEGLI